jgi:hypothetical protein
MTEVLISCVTAQLAVTTATDLGVSTPVMAAGADGVAGAVARLPHADSIPASKVKSAHTDIFMIRSPGWNGSLRHGVALVLDAIGCRRWSLILNVTESGNVVWVGATA